MPLRSYLDRKGMYLRSKFITYIDLQLFITLCSWPLLAAWGLPLSPAGILGNLLFTPFLSLFLLVSSLIFFCALLSLPHGILIMLLETITSLWYMLLSQSNRSWLFIGAHPPFYLTLLLPSLACTVALIKVLSQKKRIILLSSIYLVFGFLIPYFYAQKEEVLVLPYATKELTIIRSQACTLLLDPGVLGRTLAAPQLIQYTLIPYLIQRSIKKLDILFISKPSAMTFKALATFIDSYPVDTVYLPTWQGAWYNSGWASWEHVLRKARENKTTVVLVQNTTTVSCGSYTINLSLSPQRRKKNRLIYRELKATLFKS